MAEIKYKRETKKKKIKGMKDPVTVYKKAGSSKLYVRCNGRMRSYVSYKKSCLKKISAKKAKPVRRKTRVRGGGSCNMDQRVQQGGQPDTYSNDLLSVGGARKSVKQQEQNQQNQQQQQKKQQQQQNGGNFFNIFEEVSKLRNQDGGAKGRKGRKGRKGIKGKKSGGSNDFDMDMTTMQQMEPVDQVEEYENDVDDQQPSVLGGGRHRRRRSASPKRRRAASPKRRRSASPKRRRAASPKRRRSTRR